jgi:hypothetical protein
MPPLTLVELQAHPGRIAATCVEGFVDGGVFLLDFSRSLERSMLCAVRRFGDSTILHQCPQARKRRKDSRSLRTSLANFRKTRHRSGDDLDELLRNNRNE